MPRLPIVTITLFLLLCHPVFSQQLKPEGIFMEDSIRIGDPVPYSLSFSYPREFQVIFPDSSFDFSPFEVSSREYFPTRSDSARSFDSAVYYLSTFEIDLIQKLTVPVYLISDQDSTMIETDVDSIFFKPTVLQIPDSIALKENTTHNALTIEFNYPLFITLGFALLVILTIIYILFGTSLRKNLRKYLMNRDHRKFISSYDKSVEKASKSMDPESILKAIVLWKKYMEKLADIPYSSLTTKELKAYDSKVERLELLRSLDRSIYGGNVGSDVPDHLNQLRTEAEITFNERLSRRGND